ncbi:hypothetical protein WJX84_010637 [Apatococcus fuscideae]|uniref:Uncharacterized protein n=1 Tax=Apatococcus fuscideae TaxID=2026836 RepID=A0AAW1SZD8_9CHLO
MPNSGDGSPADCGSSGQPAAVPHDQRLDAAAATPAKTNAALDPDIFDLSDDGPYHSAATGPIAASTAGQIACHLIDLYDVISDSEEEEE